MQLNLSKHPVPIYKAYALSAKLGLNLSRKSLDVNIVYHYLLNHGSPIGLLSLEPKCRPFRLVVNSYIQPIFEDKVTTDSLADLVFRKFRPHSAIINGLELKNRKTQPPQCKRSTVWDKSAIGALIVDKEGNCLTTYRCDFCIWSIPTGTIEPNEKPLHTLKRECLEELGLNITNAQRVMVITTPKNNLLHVYKVRLDDWSKVTNFDFNVSPLLNIVPLKLVKYFNKISYILSKLVKLKLS